MIAPSDPAAERNRVGAYVERVLPRELARRGIPWMLDVEWDEHEIRAKLIRGELVISEKYTMGGPSPTAWAMIDERDDPFPDWWEPATKEWATTLAQRLASRIERTWRPVKEADSAGRIRCTVWRWPAGSRRYYLDEIEGAERLDLVLAAGVYLDRSPVQDAAVLRRIYGEEATVGEGLVLGWAEVEG